MSGAGDINHAENDWKKSKRKTMTNQAHQLSN